MRITFVFCFLYIFIYFQGINDFQVRKKIRQTLIPNEDEDATALAEFPEAANILILTIVAATLIVCLILLIVSSMLLVWYFINR